jgi:hypothetical protein
MRALSLRQAGNCEQAREHVCRCRCGGVLHGARRGDGQTFFEGLPADDPHSVPSKVAKAQRKRTEREQRDARRLAALMELL